MGKGGDKMKNTKFKNISVELLKANINVNTVAVEMGISTQALYKKLNGETNINLKDMNAIREILQKHTGKHSTLEYLFGDSNDN